MWNQFLNLFEGTGLIAMIIMFIGLFMCMIEIVIPGFGVFGVMGTLFTFAGLVVRIVLGTTITQVFVMFALILLVAILTILLVSIFAKIGLMGKSPLVQDDTVVPVDYEKPTKAQLKLIGQIGFAQTVFKTSGKFSIKGKVYEAVSTGEYIEKNSKVQVVEIRNNQIIVKKI